MQDIVKELFEEVAQATQIREAALVQAPEPVQVPKPVQEEKKDPIIDPELTQASTDIAIDFIDGLQENILKFVAQRKKQNLLEDIAGEKANIKLAGAIAQVKNKGAENLTKEQIELLNIEETVKEFIADLPFTPKEISRIEKPLKIIIAKSGGIIPPELALAMGLSTIIGGRVGDVMAL